MTPPAAAAAAARAPEARSKKKKSVLQRLNARALAIQEWAEEAGRLIDGAVAGETRAPVHKLLLDAGSTIALLRGQAEDASKRLFALDKAGWAPKKRAAGDWAVGDLVVLKAKRLKRFEGAYEKADLASLKVVAKYPGAMYKVAIFRDGLNGESLGLIPGYWLAARPAPAKK